MPPNDLPSSSPVETMQQHACAASNLLKAMGNEQRLQILCLLVESEFNVGELHARLALKIGRAHV